MRPPETPHVLPPRTDRPFGAGIGLSIGLHAALVVLIIVGGSIVAYFGGGEGPGPIGGGGGGGGAEIQYIQLPPLPAPAASSPAAAPEVDEVALALPEPTIETTVQEPEIETAPVTRVVVIQAEGPGEGTGAGEGTGTGSGGGVGSGQGTGVGRYQGPGSGGGGSELAPEPRVVLYPFEQAPESIKGVEYTLHFWVDRRGAVTKVEVEPEIDDSEFRKALIDRLRGWVFYPARTVEGRPVRGEFMAPYIP